VCRLWAVGRGVRQMTVFFVVFLWAFHSPTPIVNNLHSNHRPEPAQAAAVLAAANFTVDRGDAGLAHMPPINSGRVARIQALDCQRVSSACGDATDDDTFDTVRAADRDKVAHTDAILVTVALLTVTVAVGHALYFRDTVNIHVLELSRIVGVREILHRDDRTALETAVFVLALEDAHLAHAAALIAGANFRGVTQAHDLAGLHLVVLMVGCCSRGEGWRTCVAEKCDKKWTK
jgi:hypothetical protein